MAALPSGVISRAGASSSSARCRSQATSERNPCSSAASRMASSDWTSSRSGQSQARALAQQAGVGHIRPGRVLRMQKGQPRAQGRRAFAPAETIQPIGLDLGLQGGGDGGAIRRARDPFIDDDGSEASDAAHDHPSRGLARQPVLDRQIGAPARRDRRGAARRIRSRASPPPRSATASQGSRAKRIGRIDEGPAPRGQQHLARLAARLGDPLRERLRPAADPDRPSRPCPPPAARAQRSASFLASPARGLRSRSKPRSRSRRSRVVPAQPRLAQHRRDPRAQQCIPAIRRHSHQMRQTRRQRDPRQAPPVRRSVPPVHPARPAGSAPPAPRPGHRQAARPAGPVPPSIARPSGPGPGRTPSDRPPGFPAADAAPALASPPRPTAGSRRPARSGLRALAAVRPTTG